MYAFLFFAVLTVVLRWPALEHLTTHYIGGSSLDAGLYVWLFKEAPLSLNLADWFTTNAFYPYKENLAWSDNFILPAVTGAVLRGFCVPEILAYNSIILIALTLCGYCTYRAARVLSLDPISSLVAGTIFASYAFISGHLGHPQLQFAFWIPLAFEFAIRLLAAPTIRNGFFLGMIVGSTFLTTVYYALFQIVMIGIMCIGSFIIKKPSLRGFLTIAISPGLGLALFTPFIIPYLHVREALGPRRIYEAYYFSANALSWMASPEKSLFYGTTSAWSHSEAQLFPSLTALLLCVLSFTSFELIPAVFFMGVIASSLLALNLVTACFLWALLIYSVFNIRSSRTLVLFCAVVFFTFSFGPLGNPEKGALALAPYAIFYRFIPGLDGIRAVGRFGIPCCFFISILSAFGFAKIAKKIPSPPLRLFFSFACCSLIIAEQYVSPIPLEPPKKPPIIFNQIPDDGVVIVLPLTRELDKQGRPLSWGDFAEKNVNAMNFGSAYGLTLVNGYSGVRSPLMLNLPRWTAGFPDQASIRALKRIAGLRYVVFNGPLEQNFKSADLIKLSSSGNSSLFKIVNK
jgi:hypothetical protein